MLAHPVSWEATRQRHHALLRASANAHQGYVFQIIGDAFCIAFATALEGLAAAIDAQHAFLDERWGEHQLKGLPESVRLRN